MLEKIKKFWNEWDTRPTAFWASVSGVPVVTVVTAPLTSVVTTVLVIVITGLLTEGTTWDWGPEKVPGRWAGGVDFFGCLAAISFDYM